MKAATMIFSKRQSLRCKMKMLLMIGLIVLPKAAFATAPDLLCLSHSSFTDGSFTIDTKLNFHFKSAIAATLESEMSKDEGNTWAPACSSVVDLAATEESASYKFEGLISCVDGSESNVQMTFDSKSMKLSSAAGDSSLIYECKWL